MRILLLTDEFPPDGAGGDAAVVSNLAREYKKKGNAVFIVAATHTAERAGRGEWEGIPIERICADYHPRWQAWVSLWNPPAVRVIKKVLAEFKPDVVHAHGLNRYLSYRNIVLAHKSGARVFLTAHDAMLYHYGKASDEARVSSWALFRLYRKAYNPFRNAIIRRVLRHVEGVLTISDSIARALQANGIKTAGTVRNGIDPDLWTVPREAVDTFKEKHGLGRHVILFGGRLSGLKGAFVTVDAFVEIVKKIPDAQLLIIGTKNAIAAKMLVQARGLGVEKSIVFTGRVAGEELRAAYHSADVVAVLSRYLDGFPTINLEAYACRKPVVATSLGGSPEIVKDGITGYIVNPFDVSQIAEKLTELLEDTEKAIRFGQAGYDLVTKQFTLSGQATAYQKFFEKIK